MNTALKGSLAITVVSIAALCILGIFGFLPATFLVGGGMRLAASATILFVATFALLLLASRN